MPEDTADAVLDVAAASDVTDTTDDAQDVVVEQSTDDAQGAESTDDTAQDDQQAEQPQQDGRRIPAELKATLEAMKATNPKLAKELRNRWFAAEALKAEIPGGIQEIRQMKQTLADIGGTEGLQTLQADHKFYTALDEKWLAGDGALVDNLAEANPESFAKLGPKFLAKYGEVDGEGYQRLMSGIMARTFDTSGLNNTLWMVKQSLSLGKTEDASALLGEIEKWIADLGKSAAAPAKPAANQENDEVKQLRAEKAQREQQDFTNSLKNDFVPWRSGEIKKEMVKQFPKSKEMNPERYRIFENAVMYAINDKLGKDPDFKPTFEKYDKARDKDGLLAFNKSKNAALIPNMVREQYRLLFSDATMGAKKPAATAKPGVPGAKPAQGWVKIQGRPRPELLDKSHGKTTTEMILQGKAILKDGRQVMWDR